jgi:hypothetical protein
MGGLCTLSLEGMPVAYHQCGWSWMVLCARFKAVRIVVVRCRNGSPPPAASTSKPPLPPTPPPAAVAVAAAVVVVAPHSLYIERWQPRVVTGVQRRPWPASVFGQAATHLCRRHPRRCLRGSCSTRRWLHGCPLSALPTPAPLFG